MLPVPEIRARICCRADLVEVLRRHPLSRAFRRALDDPRGSVTVLGGFTPAEGFPYWGVMVTSRHQRVWRVRVVNDTARHCLQIRRVDEVVWADWAGGTSPVMAGDKPDLARRLKESGFVEH